MGSMADRLEEMAEEINDAIAWVSEFSDRVDIIKDHLRPWALVVEAALAAREAYAHLDMVHVRAREGSDVMGDFWERQFALIDALKALDEP